MSNAIEVELRALADQLRPEVARLAREKHSGQWWTLSGYLEILEDALNRMDRHGKRALRAYPNEPSIAAIVDPARVAIAAYSVDPL